jgi:hypothetical protein
VRLRDGLEETDEELESSAGRAYTGTARTCAFKRSG